jgi:hypothetical protein
MANGFLRQGVGRIRVSAACVDERMENDVSEKGANSQGVAFETSLSTI